MNLKNLGWSFNAGHKDFSPHNVGLCSSCLVSLSCKQHGYEKMAKGCTDNSTKAKMELNLTILLVSMQALNMVAFIS